MVFFFQKQTNCVKSYIRRDDDEVLRLEKERRPGRPTSNCEDLLKQRITMEEREYQSGFWVPDIMDSENVVNLQGWNGDWGSLSPITFIRISKDGTKRSSSFPPKGQS